MSTARRIRELSSLTGEAGDAVRVGTAEALIDPAPSPGWGGTGSFRTQANSPVRDVVPVCM